MSESKQIQRAGNDSQQIQANSIIINNGISEERVRAIIEEQSLKLRDEYTEEAYKIAGERVNKFEESIMSRLTKIDDALSSFANPEFQILLHRAQLSAATTDKTDDYDLLTELLVCHIQKGNDRKTQAGINRAVSIISEIDNDALCGLTVAHAFAHFVPVTGVCTKGIQVLNDMFKKLIYQDLPFNEEWLDHLDVLGAIRLSSLGKMKKLDEYYSSVLNGYICVGLAHDSEEFNKAILLLREARINEKILIPNELLNGYYRLAITNENGIDALSIAFGGVNIPISQEQKATLNKIWKMYSNDLALKKQVSKKFIEIWNSYDALNKLKSWWDAIPQMFTITQVGKVLAQTNAKRCDSSLPDLI